MLSSAICWLNIRPHIICNLVWKGVKCENLCVYIETTKCKWLFKGLCTLFIKKRTKLKHCLLSIKPSTWTISISITFKYSRKTWDNHCDTWITHHINVGGLTMTRLTLLNLRAMTFAMVWTTFFHVQLKHALLNIQIPTWKSHRNHRGKFPFLGLSTWTWVVIKILYHFWKLKKYHLHIGDK